MTPASSLSPDWDERLHDRAGSILQSRPWAQFQCALERQLVWQEGDGWQWTAFMRQSRGLRYLMCSYGPAADHETAMRQAMTALGEAGIQHQADFVRVEPQAHLVPLDLEAMGGRRVPEVQPTHTQVVDLTLDEVELRGRLSSGHRNLINGTERRGITIRQSTSQSDYEQFLAMLRDTAKRSRVTFFPDHYYYRLWEVLSSPGVAKLYLAEVEGRPVAAALFYDWGGTRYYAHAGAWQEPNRRAKASVSLVWQALLDAKAASLQRFDLWGVAPTDEPRHKLASLSQFKRSFGGEPVDYLGTWDLPLKRNKYRMYSLYRSIRGRK